jgi:hypothetical protein
VLRASDWHEYKDAEDIVREGEMDDRFYIIVAGQADVEANGKKIGVLSNGDCFGETSYVRGAKRTAIHRANGNVTILRVSSTLMEQVSSACQLRFNKVFLRSLIQHVGDGGGAIGPACPGVSLTAGLRSVRRIGGGRGWVAVFGARAAMDGRARGYMDVFTPSPKTATHPRPPLATRSNGWGIQLSQSLEFVGVERHRFRVVGLLEQDFDLLLGLLQRYLTLPGQLHALFELLQRLFERQLAALEPLDDGFEFLKRLLQSGQPFGLFRHCARQP